MTDTLDRPRLSRTERAAQQAHRAWRRRIIGWTVLACLLVLGAGAAYLVWWSPVLGLRSVEVTGTAGPVSPELDLQARSAVGVAEGTPLIRIDLADVESRVEQIPGVDDAAVSRHWPGTLRINLTLRTPVAAVQANASWYLIDGQGSLFEPVAAKPDGLLTLRLATPGPDDPATAAGVVVVQAIPPSLLAQVASVSAHSAYNVTVELTDGRVVIWGSAENSARKAQVLPAVLTRPGTQYDISVPDLVTVR